jgi:hypothetical protein
MSNLIVVCPESDRVEQLMSGFWLRIFLTGTVASRSSVQCLLGSDVTREAITGALAKDTGLLYFGHGFADRLGEATSLVDAENVESAAGGLIVAFACYSALELGPEAIRRKAEAYLGFDDLLAVYEAPSRAIAPGVVALLDCLAEGGSVDAAYETLVQTLAEVVDEHAFGARRSHPDAPTILLTARLMQRALVVSGNGSYSLT